MSAPTLNAQVRSYYRQHREDVLSVVPAECRAILSVGCGAGVTEGHLVRRGVSVVGIERDPTAAAEARREGLVVLEGDVQAVSADLAGYRFDCMIYADILEHLADPLGVLREHARFLAPGGVVIISVPNFRHYRVLRQLVVFGHIRYTDAGILDRTHLRITTRRMVEEWVRALGWRVIGVRHKMSLRREIWMSKATLGLIKEFVARQVIVVARAE